MLKSSVVDLLQIKYPIIQAPMAGGVTTSKFVASVSNAGGLGMIGAGYMSPVQIQEQIREIKQLTSKNFGVNLFVPSKFSATEDEMNMANQVLQPIRDQLNLNEEEINLPNEDVAFENFKRQLKVVIEEGVSVCSFTFGVPEEDVVAKLKEHGIKVVGTATSVKEAVFIEEIGMDAVVVQGSEAGGHRGTFPGHDETATVGLMALIPQVVDRVQIPVIGSGGIMDGRGVSASFCLGAQGVQMGTAFLTCVESGAKEQHKEAILQANEDDTVLTRAFSGKWARGLTNQFTTSLRAVEQQLPDFPIQNAMTKQIRKAAGEQNKPEFMSLWSGQSPTLAKKQTVAQLIDQVMSEVKEKVSIS